LLLPVCVVLVRVVAGVACMKVHSTRWTTFDYVLAAVWCLLC
jgi:hypothetical protein